MVKAEDIAVVIRSAGERTSLVCMDLLKAIFPSENIGMIESVPFSKAIVDAWNLGVSQQKEWVLCIDADVLVSYQGVNKLIAKVNDVGENVFEIQGLILDKFFPVYRPAGNHLYRTKYIDRAREMIPAEGTSLRPESDVLNKMSEAGFPWLQCDAIIGLHDYGQYYQDVYRKCFLQAHKHRYILPLVEPYWIQQAATDPDFTVALWASMAGKLYRDKVQVDKRFMTDDAIKCLKFLDLTEKSIASDEWGNEYAEDQLNRHSSHPNSELQVKIFAKHQWNRLSSERNNTRKKTYSVLLEGVGDYFIKAGKKLKSLSR